MQKTLQKLVQTSLPVPFNATGLTDQSAAFCLWLI